MDLVALALVLAPLLAAGWGAVGSAAALVSEGVTPGRVAGLALFAAMTGYLAYALQDLVRATVRRAEARASRPVADSQGGRAGRGAGIRPGRVLSAGWLLLGAGLVAQSAYDLLLRRDVLRTFPHLVWLAVYVAVFGALALLLGARLARPGALRGRLGYPLASVLLLYGLYMTALVLGEAGVRPGLLAYGGLSILAAGTFGFLAKEELRAA